MTHATVGHLRRGVFPKTKIALGKRKSRFCNGIKAAPGGKCNRRERYKHCLKREFKEEVGVDIDLRTVRLIAIIDYFVPNCKGYVLNQRVRFYDVGKWKGRVRPLQGFTSIGWYPLTDLPYAEMHADITVWLPQVIREKSRVLRGKLYYADKKFKVIKKWEFTFIKRKT